MTDANQRPGRLPDVVIIGAPKCATTSVARWLAASDDIFLPDAKELRFLNRHWARGRAWYEDQFADARSDQLVMEATPEYLADELAPSRAAELGLRRFVVILRDPIERAWSHHWFRQAYGPGLAHIARPFEDIVREEIHAGIPPSGILTHSRYACHVDRWRAANPEAAFLAVAYRQVADDPDAAFHRVRTFAGLQRITPPPSVGTTHNAGVRLRWPRLRALLIRHRLLHHLPGDVGLRIDVLNQVPRPEVSVREDVRQELEQLFAQDLAVMHEMTALAPVPGDP